jgi:hypothetical protein
MSICEIKIMCNLQKFDGEAFGETVNGIGRGMHSKRANITTTCEVQGEGMEWFKIVYPGSSSIERLV